MKAMLLPLLLLALPVDVVAEDIKELLKRIEEYSAKQQYKKALDEVGWLQKELQTSHSNGFKQYFPDDVAGFKGEPPVSQSALGFSSYERKYKKEEGQSMTVSLLGGVGGAANNAMNPLAAFGQMAAMMGGESAGQETFRLSGRTANLSVDEAARTSELTVFLESGSMLKFEVEGVSKADEVKKIAESFKISELDAYLKG